ncbi:hypothetical protein TP2_18195 [Thioclava pacifica DSM 10166]|uniref:Uncharacterized protein n=2 Tax=Thioclava pacifica TaxID=285109 RepID=A0A074JS77_9RHOB|nr:hypothetical protein TP2_18195 [Thioclava pacifica DSM 10166]
MAMCYPVFAMFPIAACLAVWWVFLVLPFVLTAAVVLILFDSASLAPVIALAILGLPAFFLLVWQTPRVFRFYWIAAGLMFGKRRAAERALAEIDAELSTTAE